MQTIDPDGEPSANGATCTMTRWVPSAILDLPPGEHVIALRTPHRVLLQALPSSRDALLGLLAPKTFEIHVELEDDEAPLRQAPATDVHGAFLTADLPLEWPLFYWLVDGLQEDLESPDPVAGFKRGRARLAMAETMLRRARRGRPADVDTIAASWDAATEDAAPADADAPPDPSAFVRHLAAHVVDHARAGVFVDTVKPWLQAADRHADLGLPALGARETRILTAYAQHRLFGAAWLAAPAGLVAGWQMFVAAHIMAVWFAGLAMRSQRGKLADALTSALWLLDQGLWRDEALVHTVVRSIIKADTATPEFTAALTASLSRALARA